VLIGHAPVSTEGHDPAGQTDEIWAHVDGISIDRGRTGPGDGSRRANAQPVFVKNELPTRPV
jgi:hypothetical protein